MAEAVRKFAVAETPLYREAPNNIEAEQALLGAILVNNDAFYRVSDFLKPAHFYEPLHRKIFEVAAELIRMGKIANPVTIKTFLPADEKVGDMTVAHYLARLAAEAVNVINAADYGRAIYDLATRRALITVGEDMVNIAYDAPVDMAPADADRGRRAAAVRTGRNRPLRRRLRELHRCGQDRRSTWPTPPSCATAICRASPPACATSTAAWAACSRPT